MYSVVLMMALSGSAEVPEFGGRSCKCSCSGYSCSCKGSKGCKGRSCKGRSRCHGCSGCYGGCYGYSCSGCYGRSSCCGTPVVTCCGCVGGIVVVPGTKEMPKKAPAKTETQAPAVILVSLPANAKLTIDGNATTSTASERTFVSPPLPQGEQFQYTLRAEVVQDGRTIVETQTVTVRGGEETRVPFNFSSTSVASR